MPQLLLELFSEEIPARMQAGAARDLERMVVERLKAQELSYDSLHTFAGPRRLTLAIDGLPAATPDRSEELKGPKASAPPQALEGFLRKTGLTREQQTERDGVLYAVTSRAGRPTAEIAAEIVGEIVRAFPWPKSMRSGTSSFRWVRPLKRVLFLFDGAVVPFEIEGIVAGDVTEGHRFLGSKGAPFAVADFADYQIRLASEFVVLDPAERKRRILDGAEAVCAALGLELIPDEGLLEEVAGLAEWPTPLIGDMHPGFLDLPPEVIRTSMRTHQKYFAVRKAGDASGRLAPHFLVVANIEASDGGAEIKSGNAKVLSARLSDARFFWDEDRKAGAFERWNDKLKGVTFHAKLGTMAERVERIAALAREIAPAVGADPDLAERAARLCKADLASAMVGEFPELQGVMGGYYVRLAGEPDAVADAVRDHYKPVGPADSVPTAPVTVAVALADKLDTLVGFFAIDEKPTGSKDPQALRRAALGVIRSLTAKRTRITLRGLLQPPLLFSAVHANIAEQRRIKAAKEFDVFAEPMKAANALVHLASESAILGEQIRGLAPLHQAQNALISDVIAFFADRLKVLLRDEGKRHDLVDAVFALGDDDLVRIVDRVEALSAFLATEDGANLLAGYKRAANILRAEAKKFPDEAYEALPLDGSTSVVDGEEGTLLAALTDVSAKLNPLLASEDFAGAMGQLARLRAPVDGFFDSVLVNDPDPEVRLRRLRLLSTLRDRANRVADFSLIQG